MIFSYRYEDTIIFYGIYLDSLQIVPCYPQKNHPIPADVLPSDSEDLFKINHHQLYVKGCKLRNCFVFWTSGKKFNLSLDCSSSSIKGNIKNRN